jgi:hypothetical protein
VIHAIGFYSTGIKIDAIPGRINLASTLRSLFKGEHRGFRFESCGQGHAATLIVGLTIYLIIMVVKKRLIHYLFLVLIIKD